MKTQTTLWIDPSLALDARRAVWLPGEGTLAVADLHLGYEWAHRRAGNLVPLNTPDETLSLLMALVADYGARRLVVLGDVVHKAVPVPALAARLRDVLSTLSACVEVTLLAGNHDKALGRLLTDAGCECELHAEWQTGEHTLLHGDEPDVQTASARLETVTQRGGRIVMGHEHPAMTLGDGIATRAKCPCFMIAQNLVILPAFSPWAAGTEIQGRRWLSGYAQAAEFTHAVAVLAGKLLPVKLALKSQS